MPSLSQPQARCVQRPASMTGPVDDTTMATVDPAERDHGGRPQVALPRLSVPRPTRGRRAGAPSRRGPHGLRGLHGLRGPRGRGTPTRDAEPSGDSAGLGQGTLQPRTFAEQFRDNVARLGAAQKSRHGVPPYTRFVNRPIGRRLAAIAALLRLSPNAVTGLSLLASVLGMLLLCLVTPTVWVGVAVAGLLLLGYALDSADGQLARLTGRGGPAGEWLDHVTDQGRTVALHMAVLIWLYRFVEPASPTVYLLPMAFAVVVSTRFLSQILGEQFRRAEAARGGGEPDPIADRYAAVRAVLQLPSDPGVLCVLFALVASPGSFLWGYGGLLALNTLLTLVSMRRRYVELRPRRRSTS